jgi:lactobin A/cerein 7B family class IIb bacteriocin
MDLQAVSLSELQEVEGGFAPLLVAVAVGAALVGAYVGVKIAEAVCSNLNSGGDSGSSNAGSTRDAGGSDW